MDRCKSCQNILPRTVDRCPVCGHDTKDDVAPAAAAPSISHPKDFLGSIRKGKESADRDAPGQDLAAQSSDVEPQPKRSSDFELPALSEQTRSVAAISSRLDSHVTVGRKSSHGPRVAVAAILAVATLGIGSAIGATRNGDTDLIAMTADEVPVGAGNKSLVVTGSVENFDPLAVVSLEESRACNGGVTTTGVVVEGGTVVALIFDAQRTTAPTITSGENTVIGDVLGNSDVNNLSVLRTDSPLPNRLQIVVGTQIRAGSQLALVQVDDSGMTLVPATVTDLKARSGEVLGFSVGTQLNEEGEVETTKPERGTLVIDRNGNLIGIVDIDGSAIAAERIAETVSQFRADPDFPGPRC
ncbi:MAG: hypothetical protein HKN03_08020 [Acidimicrobiales bacterium]|nr:hypothetical protein [Acidimicrobiales bacterium]